MVLAMRSFGRVWLCDCDSPWTLWKGDVWSMHCSQHPLDPYSFTHFSHGLIFYVALLWLTRGIDKWLRRSTGLLSEANPCSPNSTTFPMLWRFFTAIFLASAWEVAENSTWIIERYRTVTMSLEYMGDSVLNAVADVVCCGTGFWVARRIGVMWSLAILLVIELALLFFTRDNLTLNVLMLISPVDAVKQWQMGVK
ncbi:MAG: DUF2585 family protein [Phycisphaerales bacterium]